MYIAITAKQPSLESDVDPRFGRCPFLLIIDTETGNFEPIENPNLHASSGAGIQTARMLVEKDVSVLMTGNCGPNAYQTLSAVGINVVTGISGSIQHALEQFRNQQVSYASAPNVASHAGTQGNEETQQEIPTPQEPFGMGRGGGAGQGGGRGMGRGGGAGQGGGRGMGRGGGTGKGGGRGQGR
jgi:predicted Fe-Mo cluster-binding NifX family protein